MIHASSAISGSLSVIEQPGPLPIEKDPEEIVYSTGISREWVFCKINIALVILAVLRGCSEAVVAAEILVAIIQHKYNLITDGGVLKYKLTWQSATNLGDW